MKRRNLRLRLSSLKVLVALVALLLGTTLGLRRRSQRLDRVGRTYSAAAGREEMRLIGPSGTSDDGPGRTEAIAIMKRVHRYDAIAGAYRRAASRPWIPYDPDPLAVACRCSMCQTSSGD